METLVGSGLLLWRGGGEPFIRVFGYSIVVLFKIFGLAYIKVLTL
mgnify:FL=1